MKNSIKNFLIDGKSFFDLPVKNKEEAYEKVIEISRNNVYTTGNLLDYGYFWNNYKLIAVDLSKKLWFRKPWFKTKKKIYWKTWKWSNNVFQKSEELTFNFSQNSGSII